MKTPTVYENLLEMLQDAIYLRRPREEIDAIRIEIERFDRHSAALAKVAA